MLRYAGGDLSHVLIADTRNHTKHCRYIVNPTGRCRGPPARWRWRGDVDFDALFRTLREMKFLLSRPSKSAARRLWPPAIWLPGKNEIPCSGNP